MSEEGGKYAVDAPEGAAGPATQYLTRKDAKWLLLTTVILGIGFIPVYLNMREQAYRSTCNRNLSGIMAAMMLYANDNENRLPPIYNETGDGEPAVNGDGYAITWVSLVEPFMSTRISFVCPSADTTEYAYSANFNGGDPIASTYGFYGIYATQNLELIDNPDNVILLAETSNAGAFNSYDPLPFKSCKYDGMIIGWNDSNREPSESTKAVTRLSFKETAKKNFSQKDGRHGNHIHAIKASRGKINLTSESIQTEYDRSKYSLSGFWREPILRK